jgi:hypothetical protein
MRRCASDLQGSRPTSGPSGTISRRASESLGQESSPQLAYSQQLRESWNDDTFVDRDDRFFPIDLELDMRDRSDSHSSVELNTPPP